MVSPLRRSRDAVITAAPCAVVNAIANALPSEQAALLNTPVTPEKIWQALRRSSGSAGAQIAARSLNRKIRPLLRLQRDLTAGVSDIAPDSHIGRLWNMAPRPCPLCPRKRTFGVQTRCPLNRVDRQCNRPQALGFVREKGGLRREDQADDNGSYAVEDR